MSKAKVLRASDLHRARVEVTVSGTDGVIVCRRPDLLSQVVRGLLPQPLVDAVMARAVSGTFDAANVSALAESGEFIDRWVCLAAIEPRVVMTEAEASDNAVWIDDLDLNLKLAIFHATVAKPAPVDAAVAEFRGRESERAAAGSDGTPVPDPTVGVVTH